MMKKVIVTQGHQEGLDFEDDFLRIRPDFLIVTEDDRYGQVKLDEGMAPLPKIAGAITHKYCGGGYGGYALYLFDHPSLRDAALAATPNLRAIEPFCRV